MLIAPKIIRAPKATPMPAIIANAFLRRHFSRARAKHPKEKLTKSRHNKAPQKICAARKGPVELSVNAAISATARSTTNGDQNEIRAAQPARLSFSESLKDSWDGSVDSIVRDCHRRLTLRPIVTTISWRKCGWLLRGFPWSRCRTRCRERARYRPACAGKATARGGRVGPGCCPRRCIA